jgi:hypothetical protein
VSSPRTIVAEVSKTWKAAEFGRQAPPPEECLGGRFELVVATNEARGYRLASWRFSQVFTGDALVETIVAVFEYVGDRRRTVAVELEMSDAGDIEIRPATGRDA